MSTFAAPVNDPTQRQLAGRLAGLSLPRQIVVLAVWPLLEQALNFLVTFVDTLQSGHLDTSAVAAVGIAGYIIWILGLIELAVGIGATAIISRATGAGQHRLTDAALGQSLVMAAIAGVVVGAALFLLAEPISAFVELSGRDFEYSTRFLQILALANPMRFVLFVGCACYRGVGNTVTPFWVMLVVNVVNIGANYAFVLGPEPVGGHGVAGIAAATDLAWTLGALLIIIWLLRGRAGIRLHVNRLALQPVMVGRIIRIGIPNLVEVSGIWACQFFILKIIGHIGRTSVPNAIALHSVAVRVEAMSYLPGFAMSAAAATLAGQYLGAGAPEQAKRAVKLCWYTCMAIMGTLGLLFFFTPGPLIRVVTDDPEILRGAPTLLRICGPSEIFMATYLVLSQAMRGAGDTRAAMALSYFSIFCVRLPAVYTLGIVLDYKLVGIWLALCGEVAFRGVIFALWFWRSRWLEAKV